MHWILLIFVISETLVQYLLYMNNLTQKFSLQAKYKHEVIGLLQNKTSFVVFGFKVILIIVQASFVQF